MLAPRWITVREDTREVETREDGVFRGVVAVPRAPRFTLTRRWMIPGGSTYLWVVVSSFLVWLTLVAAHPGTLLLCAVFATVASLASYATLGVLVNRTTITIDDGLLRVDHGPLPWPWMPARELHLNKLARVFARVDVWFAPKLEIVAELARGGETRILRAVLDREQAEFIAHELDARLHAVQAESSASIAASPSRNVG
jgi:hypothetical protein